jgi:cyanate permease
LFSSQNNHRWFMLVLVLLATGIGIMIFAAPFTLLELWVKGLGISHAQAGALTGLWYLAFALASLPSGWLADRIPVRWLLLALWSLIVVGAVLMANAPGFLTLCLGRAVFSIGMVGHFVAAQTFLAILFEGRKEFGFVMGLYSMSMTAGVYISLFALGRIGEHSGWRAAMVLLAVLAAAGLFMMLFVRSQPAHFRQESAPVHFRPLQLGMAAWIVAIVFAGYNVATEAYLTFTPDYLVRDGYKLALAAGIVGIYAWVALSLKPFLSAFLRKSNAAGYVIAATLIFFLSVALLVLRTVPPAVSATFFGISMALAMPAVYALPAFMFGSQKSGQVYGLCNFLYGIGFLIQPMVGLTIDKTGRYTVGYGIICAVAGLSLLGAIWLGRDNLRRPAPVTVTQPK